MLEPDIVLGHIGSGIHCYTVNVCNRDIKKFGMSAVVSLTFRYCSIISQLMSTYLGSPKVFRPPLHSQHPRGNRNGSPKHDLDIWIVGG